ncbi:MAG: hypothetical protein WC523_04685 [Patescibacteria group bacterium]
MAFNFKGTKLTFEFENEEAANHFKSWLCGSGEQAYWDWMDCREGEEDGDITGLNFNYHNKNGSVIPVECGRNNKE